MARAGKRQMSAPGPDRVGDVAERATGSAELPDEQGKAGTSAVWKSRSRRLFAWLARSSATGSSRSCVAFCSSG